MTDIIKDIIRRISGLEKWKNELRLPETANDETVSRTRFREFCAHLPGMILMVDTGLVTTTTSLIYLSDAGGRLRNYSLSGGTVGTDGYVQYVELAGSPNAISGTSSSSDGFVLGNEIWISPNGLTLGAWVYFTTLTNEQSIIARWDEDNVPMQLMYYLYKSSSHRIGFAISTDGTSVAGSITSDVVLSANTWYFVSGRWTPGTNMSVIINSTVKTAATVVNAPLANEDTLHIGRRANVTTPRYMTGRVAYPFIAATPITDTNLAKMDTLFNAML